MGKTVHATLTDKEMKQLDLIIAERESYHSIIKNISELDKRAILREHNIWKKLAKDKGFEELMAHNRLTIEKIKGVYCVVNSERQ